MVLGHGASLSEASTLRNVILLSRRGKLVLRAGLIDSSFLDFSPEVAVPLLATPNRLLQNYKNARRFEISACFPLQQISVCG
jgi:hypothetical protein